MKEELRPGVEALTVRTFEVREQPLEVMSEIPEQDPMFSGNRDHYFESGRSALECVRMAMLAAGKSDVESVLDLPCGWGRQLRFLRAAFPEARFTACDIDTRGADYCAEAFGATPVYSHPDPVEIQFEERFDLIWCGSLLTHLNAPRCFEFMALMATLLVADGLLVFTTHGRLSYRRLRNGRWDYGLSESQVARLVDQFDRDGFGYVETESAEMGAEGGFGMSLSSPAWVQAQVERLPRLRVVGFAEAAWHDHQDVTSCVAARGGWAQPEPGVS